MIYIKYGDIKGPVPEEGHKEWFAVDSIQLGIGRAISAGTLDGKNRLNGDPSISEIVITKRADSASPALFKESLNGEAKKVTIEFTRTGQDKSAKQEKYLTWELTDCMISGFSMSSGGDEPTESISLNFTKLEVSYVPFDATNKNKSPEKISFDLQKGQLS